MHNEIGDQAVEYLANALQQNKVIFNLSYSIFHYLSHPDTHHTNTQRKSYQQ
jgi:hypothetical protein